jgi:tetratricopeptide (TPR) repeat protein
VLAGVLFRGSAADVALQTAKIGGGPAQGDPYGFVWVSLENTDRELVRFMSTRTSVRDVILAPDDLSALLVTSTGRAVAQLPGATSRAAAARRARLARVFYQDEAALYQLCREMDIDYVVYSIDVLLDGGDYSPRYVAGVTAMDPRSIAVRMHFEPESIEHFTLVYQNDHYRLFRVTEVAQPVFITDHPPFYHADVFARAGRNLEEFRSRVVYLMLSYAAALDDRAAGNGENARRRLAFCVEHAPRFTRARLALAEVLMDMNRHEEARAQIMAVIAYAPDNPQALYDGAWVEMQLGRPEPARAYLTLLLTQTGDTKMLERGRALQVYLEQKIPLPPGAPRP